MSSQVTVFSPMGVALADLDVRAFRSWVINGAGDASFEISTRDSKCREDLLRFGNRLLIRHDSLPDWVGIINTPRVWRYGIVEVNAIGAEAWFDWRVTNVYPLHDSLAEIFKFIIDDCNYWGGSQMAYGTIANGGIDAVAALGGKASDHINRLVDKFNVDWSVTPRLDINNRLILQANLYNGLRGDRTNLTLNNITSRISEPLLTEDGAIYNHVFYYSEPGEGGGRAIGDAKDWPSINHYDLRQIAEQGVGSYQEGLEFAAYMKLQETKEPVYIAPPAALDIGDTFKQLRLGNVIYWQNDFAGFDGNPIGSSSTLRIVGMEYADGDDSVSLVTELEKRYYTRAELINLAQEYSG